MPGDLILKQLVQDFLFAFQTGCALVESGQYKKVMVIGADKMSSIVDYTDRNNCILFGDGGAAVLN